MPITTTLFLDTVAPTLNDFNLRNNATPSTLYTNGQVLISGMDASDDSGSGIAAYEYDRGDNNWAAVPGTAVILTGTHGAVLTVRVRATDKVGNVSDIVTKNITMDTQAPTYILSNDRGGTFVKDADTVLFTAEFTETLAAAPTISITNGGVSEVSMLGSDRTWTYPWNVPAGNAAATVSISATDQAGNPASRSSGNINFTIDNAPPAIAVGSPSSTVVKGGTPVTYTLTITDDSTITYAVAPADYIQVDASAGISAAHYSKSATRSGNVVTVTVTPTAACPWGTLGITVLAGIASDAAGNPSLQAGPSTAFAVDNAPPNIAIAAPSTSIAKGGTAVTYTLTITDDSTVSHAAAPADYIQVNASAGISAAHYAKSATRTGNVVTVTVTPTAACPAGTLGITILAGIASDAVGNASLQAGPSATFAVDNTPPAIAIAAPSATLVKGGTAVTFDVTITDDSTISYAAAPADYIQVDASAGISAAHYSKSATRSGNVVTVTVMPTAACPWGTLGITVLAGIASDAAGNSSPQAGPSTAFAVDNAPPAIAIAAPSATLVKGGTAVTYAVTVTDASTISYAAAPADYIQVNASAGISAVHYAMSATRAGNVVTVTVTPTTACPAGTLGITVLADYATDSLEHKSVSTGPSTAFTVDNTAPNIAIAAPSATLVKGGTAVTYAVTVTDASTISYAALPADYIQVNASAGIESSHYAMSATRTGNVVIVTVTPTTACPAGTLGITVLADYATDGFGHKSVATGPSTTFTVDNTAPNIAIAAPSATLVKGGTAVTFDVTITDASTITYAAAPADYIQVNASAGINAVHYAKSATRSGNVVTVTVTPTTACPAGTLGITVLADYATDSLGHKSVATGPSATFTVDNTAPNIAIAAPSATLVKGGTTVTFDVTITDASTITYAAAPADYIQVNASAGIESSHYAMSATRAGNVVTVTVTPTTACPAGTLGITVLADYATDSLGHKSVATGPSATFTVDNKAPNIAIAAPSATLVKGGTAVTYAVTVTDASTITYAAAPADYIQVNASAGIESSHYAMSATRTGNVVTVTVTPTTACPAGTLGITVLADYATDGFGHKSIAVGPSATFIVDNAPPVINISSTSYDNTEEELTLVFDPTTDTSGFASIKFSGIYAADTATPTYGAPVALPGTHIAAIGLTLAVGDRFYYVVIDGAGNESDVRHIINDETDGVVSRSLASGGSTGRPAAAPRKAPALPAIQSTQARRTVPATNWSARITAFAVNTPRGPTGMGENPVPARVSDAARAQSVSAAAPVPRGPETVSSAGRITTAKAPAVKFEPEASVERPAARPETAAEQPEPTEDIEMTEEGIVDARPVQDQGVPLSAAGSDTVGGSGVPAPAAPEKFPWEGPWSRNPANLPPLGGEKSRREEEDA